MYEKVARTIDKYGLFGGKSPIVLGVSGGADSLSLLDCLAHLDYDLIVAHLDHRLRPESQAEAEYVRRMSEQYGLPFISKTLQDGDLRSKGGSLEEAARLERYNFLTDVAQEAKAKYVAVGHTADDQVETILMHLLRGAGPEGLQGMLPVTSFTHWVGIESDLDLDLVRPLIECWRAETLEHCAKIGLKPIHDPSNQDLSIHRNRIRNELVPFLERYNPRFRQSMQRFSDVMREQASYNRFQVEGLWSRVLTAVPSGGFVIDRVEFRKMHAFLQRALIREAINCLVPGLRDISYETTLRAVEWLEKPGGSLSLPGELALVSFGEDALLHTAGIPVRCVSFPQMAPDARIILPCPGKINLEAGWQISARSEAKVDPDFISSTLEPSHFTAAFSTEEFPQQLIVRTRRSGDRIQLPGVGGRTKISDLMINRKIPAPLRANWPLVYSEDTLLWAPGIQRSDEMLVNENTSAVIVLQLHPPDEESHVEATL